MSLIITPSPALPVRQRRKYVVVAVASIALLYHVGRSRTTTTPRPPSVSTETSSSYALPPPIHTTTTMRAEDIVRRSYRRTFGALSMDELCGPDVGGRGCIASLLLEATETSSSSDGTNETSSSAKAKSFPWWFVTMLRDLKAQPAVHGSW